MVNKELLVNFYKNKKVFVTGHTGFKGSWLLLLLQELGAQIKGYALAPENNHSLFNIINGQEIAESIIADINDINRLKKEIEVFQPDFIFHLAAQPLVRLSYQIPATTFRTNVAGTANLLECITALPNKCATVVVTTDKVYHNKEKDILYNENDPLGGFDPYSASKACTELVVESFRNSFFNINRLDQHQKSIASARAGNVIGGGDWSTDRIVPDVIRSLQEKQEIIVRNPGAVRPWQHVLEPLTGYLLLGGLLADNPYKYSTAYNFGPLPSDHLTVKMLVEEAIASWGSGSWKDSSMLEQPHEAGLLQLDISRAKNELNWIPKLNASSSIEWTIDWYKRPVEEQSDFTIQQINQYLAL